MEESEPSTWVEWLIAEASEEEAENYFANHAESNEFQEEIRLARISRLRRRLARSAIGTNNAA